MLRKIDLQPILIKHLIGSTTDDTPMPLYGDLMTVYGKVIDKGGIIVDEATGLNFEYDRAVIFNINEQTKFINAHTAIYIDEMPTVVFEKGDYTIERISPITLNTFTVYLNKKNDIKLPKLYFEKNGTIYETQFNYDKSTNIGYMPYNKQIPFDETSNIWNRKVSNISSTVGKIRLVSISEVNNKHTKLVFEPVK